MSVRLLYWLGLHGLLSAVLGFVLAVLALAVVGVSASVWRHVWATGADMAFLMLWLLLAGMMVFGTYGRPYRGIWCLAAGVLALAFGVMLLGFFLPWGQVSYWIASLGVPFEPTVLLLLAVAGILLLHIVRIARAGGGGYSLWGGAVFVLLTGLGAIALMADYIGMDAVFDEALPQPQGAFAPMDPLLTPAHIVPEWYMLPAYAVLRAIPFGSAAGITGVALYLLVWIALPWLDQGQPRPFWQRPLVRWFVIAVGPLVLLLLFTGALPVGGVEYRLSQWATAAIFALFLVYLPWASRREAAT